jgi:hypothetical protein
VPSEHEQTVFDLFGLDVIRVGKALVANKQLALGVGAPVDLGKSDQVEFVLLTIRVAARDHLRRGEDLLTLLDRVDAMLDSSTGRRSTEDGIDVGLCLLHVIAKSELLQEESRKRFARHAPLRNLADKASAELVRGFVARFGGELPKEIQRAFPRFSGAAEEAWRPTRAQRRLLPRLIRKLSDRQA